MPEPITVKFTDVVKKIGKNPQTNLYTVLFKRKAAFYSVEEDNIASLEALNRSFQEAIQVSVVSDAFKALIIEANLTI